MPEQPGHRPPEYHPSRSVEPGNSQPMAHLSAADSSGQAGLPATRQKLASQPDVRSRRLRVATLTDPGLTRDHQEDSAAAFTPSDPGLLARKGQLFMVADGMGGHQAGEVASQMAIAEVPRSYFADPGEDLGGSLERALDAANQAIHQQACNSLGQLGMGTTAAVVVVRGLQVHVANVGDSRVYLVRRGQITQVTEDHTWVEAQVRAGVLTREQARRHPQRNLITRALGKEASVQVDTFSGELQTDDVLVLCSDGLTAHVSNQEILQIASTTAPEEAVHHLVRLANERGGSDNISVIVVRAELTTPGAILGPAMAPAPGEGRRLLQRSSLPLVAGVLGLAVIAILLAVLLLGGQDSGQQSNGPGAGDGGTDMTPQPAGLPAGETSTPSVATTETLVPTATLRPAETAETTPHAEETSPVATETRAFDSTPTHEDRAPTATSLLDPIETRLPKPWRSTFFPTTGASQ